MGKYKRIDKAPLAYVSVSGFEIAKMLDDSEKVTVLNALIDYIPSVAPKKPAPVYPMELTERGRIVFESIIAPTLPNLDKYWANNDKQKVRRNGQQEDDQGSTNGQPTVDQINKPNGYSDEDGIVDLSIYPVAKKWAKERADSEGEDASKALKKLFDDFINDQEALKTAIVKAYLHKEGCISAIGLINSYLPDSPF